jgi:site-specific DNA-methyltransferase (adenine-specific)
MMERNRIYNEDCLETLKRLPDGCVDLFLQDTPFGVTQNDWDIVPDFEQLWQQWLRVGKENTPFLFFATQPFACQVIASMPKLFRYDLIWYKRLGTGFLNASRMPMRNHEHILVFYRKQPRYNPQMGVGVRKTGIRNNKRTNSNYGEFSDKDMVGYYDDKGTRHPQSVLDFTNGDRTTENDHPTQKPIDLIRYLVLTYSNQSDLVFDGYIGSGTTAAACILEGRDFIGSELKTEYFSIASNRISDLQTQQQLFRS